MPGDPSEPKEFYRFLDTHRIGYDRHDHSAVFTVAQARGMVPPLAAAKTKNLFLRDKKGRRHFLVVVGAEKQIDLSGLQDALDAGRLSFGSADRLQRYMGILPGAVSPFAVFNDREHHVELIVDRSLWEASAFQFHPLVNTSTLVISREDFERFVALTGHTLRLLEVPGETTYPPSP